MSKLSRLITVAAVAGGIALAPVATAMASEATPEYVATVQTGEQQFKIHLIDQNDIDAARANLAGTSSKHPNGAVDRSGPEYNTGYTWHLKPDDVEFVDVSMEMCDGVPSDVTENPNGQFTRFCPWNAKVTNLQVID